MKNNFFYLVLIIIFFSCSQNLEDEKIQKNPVPKLTDKQIDSLTNELSLASSRNDTVKINYIYNSLLRKNWKDTNNAEFFLERANVNLMKRNFKNAFKDINEAKKINSSYAYIYYVNAIAWDMYSSNSDSCLFYLSKAIKLEPNNSLYLQIRSEKYNSINEYQKALDDINNALNISPKDIQMLILRATYLHNNEDYENAILAFNDISTKVLNDNLYFYRGSCYYYLGKNELAIIDFNQAIKMNPNIGVYYSFRGGAKFKLKNRDDAFLDFKKAAELGDQEGIKLYNDCLEWYEKHNKNPPIGKNI